MNVGPTADGRIVPAFQERLLEMGAWLKVCVCVCVCVHVCTCVGVGCMCVCGWVGGVCNVYKSGSMGVKGSVCVHV